MTVQTQKERLVQEDVKYFSDIFVNVLKRRKVGHVCVDAESNIFILVMSCLFPH